jgi:hypothetical protein
MRLQLTGIKASGLRCAEFDLQFRRDALPKFTFIQMPNGTGKTTIADCLRAALSGEAADWDRRHVASFQRIAGSDTGLFEARFSFDGSPLAVGMKFDFIERAVSYYTTIARGRLPKHNLPPSLARFADPSFVRLYIFDAELPQELLSGTSNRAEQAIDAFYQLYVLEQLATAVQSYWEAQVQGASTQQGLARHRNRLAILTQRKERLESALLRYRAELDEHQTELAAKEPELEQHLSLVERYRQDKEGYEEELATASADLTAILDHVVGRLQRPLDVHPVVRSALDHLAAGLDSLKLPESTSRSFFIDLTSQPECICNRPMTTEARQNIINASERLLSDDTAGVINAFKNDLRSFHRDENSPALVELAETVAEVVRARDTANSRLEALRSDASERADQRARELKQRIDWLHDEVRSIKGSIAGISRDPRFDDDETSGCLKWFEQEIQKLEQLVAEVSRLVTLRERKDLLREVLTESAALARNAAREELVAAMNSRLELLLPGEQVYVSDIGPSLLLEGRDSVNLGAMLSIGYSFLTTLFERGNHHFPFIVDAPTMGLDGLAREALADILPRATDQFVGFVLDNERDFVRRVRENSPSECEFFTVFSDSSRNKPLANQVPEGVVPGEAGTFVISGFEFFDQVTWTKNVEVED